MNMIQEANIFKIMHRDPRKLYNLTLPPMIERPSSIASFVIAKLCFHLFARLAFDLSLKALRHSFAITEEATEEGLFIIGEGVGVIQLPGFPVDYASNYFYHY